MADSEVQTSILLDISSRLGRVEGQNDQILLSQGRAEESRKEIHEQLNETNERLTACEGEVKSLGREFARISPIISTLEASHYRAQGSAAFMTKATDAVKTLWGFTVVRLLASSTVVVVLGWVGIKLTKPG